MHKHRQICEESDKAQLSLKSTNHKLSREVSCLSINQTAHSRYYAICTCFLAFIRMEYWRRHVFLSIYIVTNIKEFVQENAILNRSLIVFLL